MYTFKKGTMVTETSDGKYKAYINKAFTNSYELIKTLCEGRHTYQTTYRGSDTTPYVLYTG